MKKVLLILSAILGVGAVLAVIFPEQAAEAVGHIGIRNVKSYLRTKEATYQIWLPDRTNNTTDVTAGEMGIIAVERVPVTAGTVSNTSTIAALPYPCKVMVYVKDGSTADTVSCTGDIVICGRNQFGDPVNLRASGSSASQGCETITTDVTEGTTVKTERVFETVTSISAATCSGTPSSEAGNRLMFACAPDVGLPFPIDNYGAVLSVCATEASDTDPDVEQCWNGAYALGVADSEDVDLDDDSLILYDNSVNTTGIGEDDSQSAAFEWGNGDFIRIRVRAPAGL